MLSAISRVTRGASLAIVVLAAGCSARAFRPVNPWVAVDFEAEARIEDLTLRSFPGAEFGAQAGVTAKLDLRVPPGATIADVRLTSSRLRPCQSGVPQRHVYWLPSGDGWTGDLTVDFARDDVVAGRMFDDRTAVIDLSLAPPDRSVPNRCLRLPLVQPGDGDAWIHHAFLIGGEERVMVLATSFRGVHNPGLVLGVGLGAWAGRWRWMLEGEGGLTGREDTGTGATRQGRLFGLWGGGASVSTLVSTSGHRGIAVLGGYEVLHPAASGPADSTGASLATTVLHGPRLGLQLLYLVDPPRWPGFRGPADAFAGGVSLYIGNWWSDLSVAHPIPFVGAALEGNLGF